jgi:hypothetical protein
MHALPGSAIRALGVPGGNNIFVGSTLLAMPPHAAAR